MAINPVVLEKLCLKNKVFQSYNMMLKEIRFLVPILIISFGLQAQNVKHRLSVGSDFPVQYKMAYRLDLPIRLSPEIQFGIITKLYDKIIINTIEFFGADDNLIEVIRHSFESGKILSLRLMFNFSNYYSGIYGQRIALNASDNPISILNAYFERDFSILGNFFGLKLNLESIIYQGGFVFGRFFNLRIKNLCFFTEIAFSFNMTSKNHFSSQTFLDNISSVESLYSDMESDIKRAYKKYIYLPSVNFGLSYEF